MSILFQSLIISGITLLIRITIKEKFVEDKIDKLPYLLRKPVTCGVCRTFWIAFAFQFVFESNIATSSFSTIDYPVADFFYSWMIVGMISVAIFYIFLTFYEGSHYLAHKAEEMHS